MKNIKTYLRLLKEIKDKDTEARGFIERAFLNMPDNPRIHRLARNCFVMNFSDTTLYPYSCWDPETYDFKRIGRLIIERIKTCDLKSVGQILRQIVEKGTMQRFLSRAGRSNTIKIHPDIRKFVNKRFFNGELEMKTGLWIPGEKGEEIERKRQQCGVGEVSRF